MRINITFAVLAAATTLTLSACGDLLEDRCLDATVYPTTAMQQQCQDDRAARLAAMRTGGGGSRESLADSQARSGEMSDSETQDGPAGTTDSGESTGISAISG